MKKEYVSQAAELFRKVPEELRTFVLMQQKYIREGGRVFAEWYFHGDLWLEELDELALIPFEDSKDRERKKERIVMLIDGWLCDYHKIRVRVESREYKRRQENI